MMKTPHDILEFVGHDAAAKALGVKLPRIQQAARGDLLPPAWLDVLEGMARRPLDRRLFNFKRAEREDSPE